MTEINNNDSGLVARNAINENDKLNSATRWVNLRQARGIETGGVAFNYIQLKVKTGSPFKAGDLIKIARLKRVGNLTERGAKKYYSWKNDDNLSPYWLSKIPDLGIFEPMLDPEVNGGRWVSYTSMPNTWDKTTSGKYLKGIYRKLRNVTNGKNWTISVRLWIGVFREDEKIWENEAGKLNITLSPTNSVVNITLTNRSKTTN